MYVAPSLAFGVDEIRLLLFRFDRAHFDAGRWNVVEFGIAFCDGDGFFDIVCSYVVVANLYFFVRIDGGSVPTVSFFGERDTFADDGLCGDQIAILFQLTDVYLAFLDKGKVLVRMEGGFGVAGIPDIEHKFFLHTREVGSLQVTKIAIPVSGEMRAVSGVKICLICTLVHNYSLAGRVKSTTLLS